MSAYHAVDYVFLCSETLLGEYCGVDIDIPLYECCVVSAQRRLLFRGSASNCFCFRPVWLWASLSDYSKV